MERGSQRSNRNAASVVHTYLTYLLSMLNTLPDTNISSTTTTTSDHTKTQILENANTIQNLLEEGLRRATNLFPNKAPFSQSTGENRSRF